jgi:hypothetical protein
MAPSLLKFFWEALYAQDDEQTGERRLMGDTSRQRQQKKKKKKGRCANGNRLLLEIFLWLMPPGKLMQQYFVSWMWTLTFR